MKRTLTIVALMAVLSMAAACEKKDQTPPTPQTTEQAPPAAAPATPQETAPAPSAGTTAGGGEADQQKGEKVYNEVCATCHGQGVAGAPRIGDKEAWKPRIAKGMDALVKNSIQGFQGNQGVMPPKGGVQSLSDEDVAAAVAYMVDKSR